MILNPVVDTISCIACCNATYRGGTRCERKGENLIVTVERGRTVRENHRPLQKGTKEPLS